MVKCCHIKRIKNIEGKFVVFYVQYPLYLSYIIKYISLTEKYFSSLNCICKDNGFKTNGYIDRKILFVNFACFYGPLLLVNSYMG